MKALELIVALLVCVAFAAGQAVCVYFICRSDLTPGYKALVLVLCIVCMSRGFKWTPDGMQATDITTTTKPSTHDAR